MDSWICDCTLGRLFVAQLCHCSEYMSRAGQSSILSLREHRLISPQPVRWKVIATFDFLIEMSLVILPGFMVWSLQMPMHLKLQVVFAFVFRLL